MKKILLLFAVFAISAALQAQSATRFFEKKELMTVGTYYYPEQWSPSEWERDMKKISDMGFEFVHLAEFAWIDLEPEEGKFNFQWLDKVVELAAKYHLKVVLGTPTATTPVWMGIKYPEIYTMNANYQRQEHGSRVMSSLTNPKFRQLSARIITELAKHYGQNKAVWGWQLDNEPEAKADFSPSSQEAFKLWLSKKYKSIDKLNTDWGTEFWSQKYSAIEQVKIPNAQLVGWWGSNPHTLLDFKRFSADMQADFFAMQDSILKRFISPSQFVTSNFTAWSPQADPERVDKLDFFSFTAYPNYGSANIGDLGFRLGNSNVIAFANDYYRPLKQVLGVMELQPGQVNWASTNPLLYPGTVRLWLYHCFASGCSFACTYRFRQINYGCEQYHAGLMKQDGVTPSQGGLEYQQVATEMQQLRKAYKPNSAYPAKLQARKTGLLWNFENLWSLEQQKQTNQWDTKNHFEKYYKIVQSFGAPIDIISEKKNFDSYKVLIAPAYELVDSALIDKLTQYVQQGGNLVLTVRTGVKDRRGHTWKASWGAPIYNLIDANISDFDQLTPNGKGTISYNGKTYNWNNWADLVTPNNKANTVAVYTNQFYAGKAAVVKNKLGKGTVTYIGVDTDDATLEKEVLRNVYAAIGCTTESYPEGVFVQWRDGFWVAFNYTSELQTIDIPSNAKILLGEKTLQPAGVVIWQE